MAETADHCLSNKLNFRRGHLSVFLDLPLDGRGGLFGQILSVQRRPPDLKLEIYSLVRLARIRSPVRYRI